MYNELTKGNLITIIISLIVTGVSFLSVVYFIPMITSDEQIKLFLTTIVSTIGAAFLVNFLWEIFAKKRFAESIFEVAKISKNIQQSGVDHIDTDFSSINWKNELLKTHNFTAIFTYAQTWRNSNRVAIQNFINKNNNFIVIMPDYENDDIMAEFDRRYNYKSGKPKSLIYEAVIDYAELGAKVYLYNKSLQATYYVMDNVALMAFFKHSPGKATVPYIRAESTGSFYDYIEEEKNAILSASVSVSVTIDENGNKIIIKEK